MSSVTLQTANALFDNQFSDAHLPTWASDQSNKHAKIFGQGCGTVGRTVASHSREPRFEYSYWQFLLKTVEMTKIKKIEADVCKAQCDQMAKLF